MSSSTHPTRSHAPIFGALLAGLTTACSSNGPSPAITLDCPGAGVYELTVPLGSMTLEGRLDLVCLDGRAWGRLRVALPGETLSAAVARAETVGDTLRFMAGGALAGFDLIGDTSDSTAGILRLGGGRQFPLAARRQPGEPPADLEVYAQLTPWRPGEVSSDSGESYPVVAPDGTVFFTRHGAGLTPQQLMVLDAGQSAARPLLDLPPDVSDRSPFLSPDGSRLLFSSNRDPGDPSRAGDGYRLWSLERRPGAWGLPSPLEWTSEDPLADPQQPSVSADGTLYFVDDREGGLGGRDVYVGRWDGRSVDAVRRVEPPINDAGDQTGAYVNPEGDLMIVGSTRGPGSQGGDDLYWSRLTPDGWSPPRNFGPPINSFANEYGAWLDPEGRRLWFGSDRYGWADIFVVDLDEIGVRIDD